MGFACSFKTTSGKILASKLGYGFVDSDEEISRIYGCSITDIFQKFGEQSFREKEGEILSACCKTDNVVISCGGGSPMSSEFKKLASCSSVVWLQSSVETVFNRLDGVSRPLFDGLNIDSLSEIISQRNAIYAEYSQKIAVSTDNRTPNEVADIILVALKQRAN